MALAAFPLIRPYDPIQLTIATCLKLLIGVTPESTLSFIRIMSKAGSCLITGFLAGFAGTIVFTAVMIMCTFVEFVQKLSSELFGNRYGTIGHLVLYPNKQKPMATISNKKWKILGKITKFRVKPLHMGTRVSQIRALPPPPPPSHKSLNIRSRKEEGFASRLKIFRILQLLLQLANEVVHELSVVGMSMGMLVASVSGFCIVKLHDAIPFFIYMGGSLMLPAILLLNFLLITLVSIPQGNGERFREFWGERLELGRRWERMQLRSCPPIGYNVGRFIKRAKKTTALTITDSIFNGIATLCLAV